MALGQKLVVKNPNCNMHIKLRNLAIVAYVATEFPPFVKISNYNREIAFFLCLVGDFAIRIGRGTMHHDSWRDFVIRARMSIGTHANDPSL